MNDACERAKCVIESIFHQIGPASMGMLSGINAVNFGKRGIRVLFAAAISIGSLPAHSQSLGRVQYADRQYDECRKEFLGDLKKMQLMTRVSFTLEDYCRCVGNNVAALLSEQEVAYIQKHGRASPEFVSTSMEVRRACAYATPSQIKE